MKATITFITIDTEGQDDMVLAVPQITRTLRELAAPAPAAPRNGGSAAAQLPAPTTNVSPAHPVETISHDAAGVTIRPPAETVDTTSRPALTYYTTCIDCGEPKTKSTSPRCRRCAIKRGQLAARTAKPSIVMEKAARHNDNA